MSISLLASQVPPPQPFVAPLYPQQAADSQEPAILSPSNASMADLGTTLILNETAIATEMAYRFGGGCYGIAYGLELTAGAGLELELSSGIGRMDGPVATVDGNGDPSDLSATATASATRYWWFNKDATMEQTSTTTPPHSTSIYLGRVTAGVSSITNVDTSGVVYIIDGQAWRWTADEEEPSDSPDADLRIYTVTSGGTWFWNGTTHLLIPSNSKVPTWRKKTLAYTAFQTGATTNTINLWLFPAGTIIHAVKVNVGTAFSGSGIVSTSIDVGKTGSATAYIAAQSGGSTGHGSGMLTPQLESETSTVQSQIKMTSVGANLSALSAGSLTVHFLQSAS